VFAAGKSQVFFQPIIAAKNPFALTQGHALVLGTRIKRYNLAVQEMALKKRFPNLTSRIKRSELTWKCDLTPSPLSDTYRIGLRYKLKKYPKVEVLSPTLQKREDEQPSHLYSYSKQRLCLFLPRAEEWDGSMILVKTVVPWACEWLLQYEIWLATGEWYGVGIHPGKGDEPE